MTTQHAFPETRKTEYEEKARGLQSYIKEVTDMAASHGTDTALIEEDLVKARSDVEYYENEAKLLAEELEREARHETFQVYEDASGEWRWRLLAGNQRIIADSGEGYQNKQDCLHGIELVKDSKHAPVKEES